MRFLKELVHYFRFSRKTKEKEKEIVFYAEHRDYYPNFAGIIRQLWEEYQQPFCYITSDYKDPVFQQANPKMKVFYINKLLPFFMLSIKSKVFIMTLTDLNQYHLKRSLHPVHYVYVFHSLVSTHMMYRLGAFAHYDSILCAGPHHIRELRQQEKQYQLPAKTLIEAGYYRLERIYTRYQKQVKKKKDISPGKTTILVAPSWGKDNVIESCGKQLVEVLLGKGYEVIVRPHPETLRRSPQIVKALDSKFNDHPCFFLERSVATDDSLLNADILISDCSGVALEYAFGTERPVIFLDVPYKIQNDKYLELGIEPLELSLMSKIGVKASPKKLDALPGLIESLIKEKTKFKEQIIKQRQKNVFAFNRSSLVSARHIMDILRT
ncbi:MAG: CDP-glycerol glycerophosphotransferase family protein [Candidatus Aminicenantes bacterium]|jgi:YidC/Oxa1 family membrane protein insertase